MRGFSPESLTPAAGMSGSLESSRGSSGHRGLFVQESKAGYRLLGLLLASCVLLGVEATTPFLTPVRTLFASAVAPLHFAAAAPHFLARDLVESVRSRADLTARNAALERELLSMKGAMGRYQAILNENARLRELLESGARLRRGRLLAELVGTSVAPLEIVIDKGSLSGVVVGQTVIDSAGLFGQVVATSALTSRVLLIADPTHAVPVRVLRNDVRGIATGAGRGSLAMKDVAVTVDMIEGDELVTSGLGGRFPAGYPVGLVESVDRDQTEPFAKIAIRPHAALDTARQVLVLSAAEPERIDASPSLENQQAAGPFAGEPAQ